MSLSGTAPLAAIQYLKDHPNLSRVYLCLDNDDAGRDGAMRLRAAIAKDPELAQRGLDISEQPPRCGKDYNEQVQVLRASEVAQAHPRQLAMAR